MTAELAAGFTVNAGESMNFNNLFMDLDTRDRFFEKLSSLKEAWNNAKFNDEGIQQLLLQNQLAIAVSKFIKNESVIFQKAIESADHEFYWEPGEYELELVIDTNRPRKSFRFAGTFRLTQKESERLRANIHKMLMEFCDISGVPHDFAFPKVQWEHIHA